MATETLDDPLHISLSIILVFFGTVVTLTPWCVECSYIAGFGCCWNPTIDYFKDTILGPYDDACNEYTHLATLSFDDLHLSHEQKEDIGNPQMCIIAVSSLQFPNVKRQMKVMHGKLAFGAA
jgi:hypothetical protein